MFSLQVMVALELYRFEPERVFDPEDDDSRGEEMNKLLESTFLCICGECHVMPTVKECTCCHEQPTFKDKMEDIQHHFSSVFLLI